MGKKKTATDLEVLDLYTSLLNDLWVRASELIGETLLAFLILLSIERTSEKFPLLRGIRVSETGVSLETLRNSCQDASSEDIHRALQGLVKNLFNVFTIMSENIINRELFSSVLPKLRDAERMLSR
jgi:hypothetical protein